MVKGNLVIPRHRSLTDWDFMADHYYSLSPLRRISDPTALRSHGAPGSGPTLPVLCRDEETLCLPTGRLAGWFYCESYPRLHGFTFRNQSPLGEVIPDNHYSVGFTWLTWHLNAVVNGIVYPLASFDYETEADRWYHRAVSWQTAADPEHLNYLEVIVEQEISGKWENLPGRWYHSLNYWQESEINRCGLNLARDTDHPVFTDDTEIFA